MLLPLLLSCFTPISFTQGFGLPKNSDSDVWPTEAWATSTPEEQNMSSTWISKMYDFIYVNEIHISSVLIARNGLIVEEAYLEDYQINENLTQPADEFQYGTYTYNAEGKLRNWYSTTKSITSLLIGIAIDNGFIDNINQTFFEFFPEKWNSSYDPRKLDITIGHLLTLTSGIPWEIANYPLYPFWIKYPDLPHYIDDVLALNLTHDPGDPFEVWDQYSSDATNLLTAIINRTTGMYPEDFAQQYLFGPLGISKQDWEWYKDSEGINFGGSGLCMHRRDMAKVAYLCLRNGNWDGTQILSKEYLQEATTPRTGAWGSIYGYLFYLNDYTTNYSWYSAAGAFGQNFYVIPDLDLIVLFNGLDSNSTAKDIILKDYIIASILNYGELESNGGTTIPGTPIALLLISILTIMAIKIKKSKEKYTN